MFTLMFLLFVFCWFFGVLFCFNCLVFAILEVWFNCFLLNFIACICLNFADFVLLLERWWLGLLVYGLLFIVLFWFISLDFRTVWNVCLIWNLHVLLGFGFDALDFLGWFYLWWVVVFVLDFICVFTLFVSGCWFICFVCV